VGKFKKTGRAILKKREKLEEIRRKKTLLEEISKN